jgi:hypothetical protein
MTTNAYSDNLNANRDSVTLRDYNHAQRLYLNNNLKFTPKTKFLYHTFFALDPSVGDIVQSLTEKYGIEIGMLVKSADLPKFTANVETKNKYNRKKNIQTNIVYDPITITFHDDNHGVTTALLEAYYRFYYADAWYGDTPGAYSKLDGDTTYKGSARNQYRYGLDNNLSVPFFRNIQISQMARSLYTTYTLVNPIITNWQHDSVDSEGGSTFMQNTITVQYEAVHYDRGTVEVGSDGNPVGYGTVFYDTRPSPIAVTDPESLSTDINVTDNRSSSNNVEFNDNLPLQSANSLFSNLNRSTEQASEVVGGLDNISIPINGSGTQQITQSVPSTATTSNNTSTSLYLYKDDLQNNFKKLDLLALQLFKDQFLQNGGSGINNLFNAWDTLPETQKEEYRKQILEGAL